MLIFSRKKNESVVINNDMARAKRRKYLEERERALWDEHGSAWRASLPPVLWHPPSVPR
jgi:hypothetical protein